MRGLTRTERYVLTASEDTICDPAVIDYLVRRGLMTMVGRDRKGELWLMNQRGKRVLEMAKLADEVSA